MKRVLGIVLLCLVIAECAKEYDMNKPVEELFDEYMSDFGITFFSDEHLQSKFKVFSDNVDKIRNLNLKYSPKTKFNLNKFALLSEEEFKKTYLSPINPIKNANAPVLKPTPMKNPESFDWRDNKAPVVTPVKDQGACGSCWAFSTTGNIEGQWALSGKTLTALSEQNLVDCDHHCMTYENQKACDAGCNGGLMPNAFMYVIENGGIDTEASYKYQGYDGTCRYSKDNIGAKISNWTYVSEDEDEIASVLIQRGPLSVAVEADMWQFYFGGVFYLPCGTSLDHGVLVVGYGVETNIFFQTMPYWIVKNSWGADWGSSGYIYVERGNGKCGINTYVSTSLV